MLAYGNIIPTFTNRKERVTTMERNITATITTNTATINAFDGENIITVKCNVSAQKAEAEAIAFCESNNLIFCEILEQIANASKKYAVDEQEFFAKATKAEKRPAGAYISRTVKTTTANILVYSGRTHKADTITVVVRGDNEDNILKRAKAVCRTLDNVKPLKVLGYTVAEQLYVMKVDDFIRIAHEIVE